MTIFETVNSKTATLPPGLLESGGPAKEIHSARSTFRPDLATTGVDKKDTKVIDFCMEDRTQAELAYSELSRRILIQEIGPRNRIVEQFWSKKLQVNRAAIRESLTRMLGEDLVYRGSRGGYFVREMTANEIHELREVREILETAAISMACDRASAKQVKEIEETCNDFANFVKKSYLTGAHEADLRFHNLLIAAAGNARLTHLYERSHIPLFQRKSFPTRTQIDDFIKTEREHRLILEALRRRDKKAAIQHLKDHFNRGEQAAVS